MKTYKTLTARVLCPECDEEIPFQFDRSTRDVLETVECPQCGEEPDLFDIDMAILASIDDDEASYADYLEDQREDERLFERNSNL